MRPLAIFYHCLFALGDPGNILDRAVSIVGQQMEACSQSQLTNVAEHFCVGINGGEESKVFAELLLPAKAQKVYHGLESHAENLTIVELEKWAPAHPGWNVLYFHAKGSTHAPDSSYGNNVSGPWRDTMTRYLVMNWRACVGALEGGYDIACCHWLWNQADGTQHIPAGNFLWVTSDFVARLPSIYLRDRIKQSGIANAESRYEAEVYWGNGPRPNVFEFLPRGGEGCP